MRLLCETVVQDILPAVRALIAKELQEEGYNQTEIADALDLTQPAVSQYLSAARGKKVQRIEEDPESAERVEELVSLLMDGAPDDELSRAFCQTCLQIRENELFDAAVDGSEDLSAVCDLGQDGS